MHHFYDSRSKEMIFCQILRFTLAYLNGQVRQHSYESACSKSWRTKFSLHVPWLSNCVKLLMRLKLLREKHFPVDILGWKIGSLRSKKWRPSVYPIIEAAWGQTSALLLPIQPALPPVSGGWDYSLFKNIHSFVFFFGWHCFAQEYSCFHITKWNRLY